jgi:hypothetical protein
MKINISVLFYLKDVHFDVDKENAIKVKVAAENVESISLMLSAANFAFCRR